MRILVNRLKKGNVSSVALAATAFIALATIFGITNLPAETEPKAKMFIETTNNTVLVGETFTANIMVASDVPTNVFAGELIFNQEVLSIEAIDYNVSVADLWAETPWYSNGEGTLVFGGGTTKEGGFVGQEILIKVVFKAVAVGEGTMSIKEPRILKHDGLGSDVALYQTNDVVLTVREVNLVTKAVPDKTYSVVEGRPSTDLNDDGKQTIADTSIFMMNMVGDNPRYDFNLDGEVNFKDLNILLGAE